MHQVLNRVSNTSFNNLRECCLLFLFLLEWLPSILRLPLQDDESFERKLNPCQFLTKKKSFCETLELLLVAFKIQYCRPVTLKALYSFVQELFINDAWDQWQWMLSFSLYIHKAILMILTDYVYITAHLFVWAPFLLTFCSFARR